MNQNSNKTVVLFMTFGMSLKKWHEMGILSRELKPYLKLAEEGIKILIVTYGDAGDLEFDFANENLEILPVFAQVKRPSSRLGLYLNSFCIPWKFRKKLKKADVFKSNQMWGAWVPAIAKLLLRKPFLLRCGVEYYHNARYTVKSKLKLSIVWIMSYFLYKYADKILVTNEDIAKFAIETFKVNRNKITIRWNSIDMKLFSPDYEVKKHEKRVLWIGRLSQEKNPMLCMESMHDAGIGVDLIGEGPLHRDLKAWKDDKNADVKLLGKVENHKLPALLNQYSVFVISSRYEGNPKALLEAMSCGLAIVGSNVVGINNIIKHEKNGLLFYYKHNHIKKSGNYAKNIQNDILNKNALVHSDMAELQNAVKRLLKDSKLRSELAENGIETIKKQADINDAVKIEKEIIATLCSKADIPVRLENGRV